MRTEKQEKYLSKIVFDHYRESEAPRLFIWGLRRVGNHAIIEWIAQHGFKRVIHNNDIIGGRPWAYREYGENAYDEKCPIDLHIDSYEDFEPTITKTPEKNRIFFLRDWYNVASSRHVSGRGYIDTCRNKNDHRRNRSCEEVYIKYCELWDKYPDNFILYNQWCTDADYLKSIEKRFGWEHSPRTNKMPKSGIGEGSSFDNVVENSNIFNERYLDVKWKEPETWEQMTNNPIVNDYCEKIFDMKVEEL